MLTVLSICCFRLLVGHIKGVRLAFSMREKRKNISFKQGDLPLDKLLALKGEHLTIPADKILELCDSWCQVVQLPEGGIGIGGESEQYRLLRNGVQFHELDYDGLKATITGLSKVLLLPGLNTVVDQDHFGLWSWCAEIILSRESEVFEDNEYELRKLFETCVRASLAHCKKPAPSREEWDQQIQRDQLIPHNAKFFIQESGLALAYLVFPLLEGICKKLCFEFISMDGRVVRSFSVPTKNGGTKDYDPNGRWNQKQCSSLRDLLFLTLDQYPSPEFELLRQHISLLDSEGDPFDVIYKWRNQSLHGSTSFQTIGGTLLNIAMFLLVISFEHRYDDSRLPVLENCRRNSESDNRSPWSYYPPY